jgi:hypothetical protein
MDHLSHPVGGGLDHLGDDRDIVAARGRERREGPSLLQDRVVALVAPAVDDSLELTTIVVGQSSVSLRTRTAADMTTSGRP